jgi:radical SAM superfamily enzyme YgiQ (UPF0313 family)
MKLQMIETALTAEKVLSIGAWYVKRGLERQGHTVDVHDTPQEGYDAELISAHHVTDYKHIVTMPKVSTVRVIGGHALYSNHRPLIPFTDYFAFGEWDSGFQNFDELVLPKSDNISFRVETQMPPIEPYLSINHPKTWVVEIARGCPYKCKFCEIGNIQKYRERSYDEVKSGIDLCNTNITRRINFIAPESSSHRSHKDILKYAKHAGFFSSGVGSARLDHAKQLSCTGIPINTLIRVGVDGLTEQRRFSVGKRITDRMIFDYFRQMTDVGHVNFKMFMIFGYEEEVLQDFDQFARIMHHVLSLPVKKNTSLRIKWTPFIPQPGTPLASMKPRYDRDMVNKILSWHETHRHPKRSTGIHIENDGLMSQRNHAEQVRLMTATEEYFL